MSMSDDPRRRCPNCGGSGIFAEKACSRCGGAGTILVVVDPDNDTRGVCARDVVLPVRIELTTSPLPRECSTTELRQRSVR